MDSFENTLNNYLESTTKEIQEILFLPNVTHPIWSDNLEILQLANQQILQPIGIIPEENLIAFVGMHAKIKPSTKRYSIGFLITNFRVLMQTDFSIVGDAKTAKVYSFCQNQSAEELSSKINKDFSIKNTLEIPQDQLVAIQAALCKVLDTVLPELQKMNYLPREIVKTTKCNERIMELGLQNALKTYSQEEKKLKKFAEKYNISEIQYGAVDKPLFGGVYGIVLTLSGITSRDLMEDSFSSTWNEIREYPATVGEKEDIILAGKKIHFVPSHLKTSVPSIIELVNELANSKISF